MGSRTMPDGMRMLAYCKGLKDLPDDSLIVQGLRFLFKYGLKPFILMFMFYVWLGKMLYKVYEMLPHNVLHGIFGIGLCFFGGAYFATFAAVEAEINLGGPDLWRHLTAVWEEGNKVASASMEDDTVDADQDNIADVDEMGWNEYASHKAMVAMVAVENPERLNEAFTALFNVWISVLATLKFHFARTIAISGCYSALRGGKLFALAVLNIASFKRPSAVTIQPPGRTSLSTQTIPTSTNVWPIRWQQSGFTTNSLVCLRPPISRSTFLFFQSPLLSGSSGLKY